MVRNLLKRTPRSFPVDGPPFGRNLVLVHGLRTSEDDEFNHQASLESWVKRWDACRDGGYQFRPFRFRSSEILNEGIGALRQIGFNLLSKLQTIKDEFRVANEDARVDESPNGSRTSPPLKRPLFVFVAHGFGAWLVRHILSSRDANWIATDTIGLIFLDVIEIPNNHLPSSEPKEHEQIIKQLRRQFSGDFPGGDMDAKVAVLARGFQEIDTNFNKAREKLAAQLGLDDPLPTRFLTVWNIPSTEQIRPKQLTPQLRPIILLISSMRRFSRRGSKIENSPKLLAEIATFIMDIGKLERRNAALVLPDPQELDPHRMCTPSPRGSGFRLSSSSSAIIYRAPSSGDESQWSSRGSVSGGRRRIGPVHQRSWDKAAREARSFLERGKLSNAMTLFQDALEDLQRKPNHAEFEVQQNKIKAWIAVITLLKGDAAGAGDELQRLLTPSSTQGAPGEEQRGSDDWEHVKREMRRWLGVSLVCQGKYADGVAQLEGLVGKDPATPATDASTFKAKRELAIAYGLQGTITKARDTIQSLQGPLTLGGRKNSTISIVTNYPGFDSKNENLAIAAAFIEVLWGNFDEALKHVTGAFAVFEQHLGLRHIKTFQAASLRAYLMALMGQTQQAEKECKRLLQILPRELGSKHPVTLKVTGTLVYVYRTQRRLIEATRLAKTACEDARTVLPAGNPLTLRLKAELACCHRAEGKYSTSKRLLEDVLSSLETPGEGMTGMHTLEGLRFEAELAHVECRSGNLEDAERRAIGALKKQRQLFDTRRKLAEVVNTPSQSSQEPPSTVEADNTFVERLLEEVREELELRDQAFFRHPQQPLQLSQGPYSEFEKLPIKIQHSDEGHEQVRQEAVGADSWVSKPDEPVSRPSVLQVHPLLLYTLRVLALVRSQLNSSDEKQACRMLELVLECQSRPGSRGPIHPVSLMTEYDFAVVLRGSGDHENAKARFEHVFSVRARVLGPSHPDTVAAKRELVITMCLVNSWRHPDRAFWSARRESGTATSMDTTSRIEISTERPANDTEDASTAMDGDDWDQVEECSQAIWAQHQNLLGKRHPETLKSLIWIFTLQLLLAKIESADLTCDSLLDTLRSSAVVGERLLDAVQMEGRLAQLYMERSHEKRAERILEHIDSLSDQLPRIPASQQLAVRTLKHRILASVRAIQLEQRKPAADSGKSSFDEMHSGAALSFVRDAGSQFAECTQESPRPGP